MTSRNKINLSIFIFIILAILIVVFVIFPFYSEIKKNSQELITQKKKLATLETRISYLKNFKILYRGLEEILEKIDNLFVNPEVPVEFIGFLENKAEECRLKMKISPAISKKTEKDLWSYLAFQINSTGYSPDFLKFIEKLENSPYLIEIENLTINRADSLGNVNSVFIIKVYTK